MLISDALQLKERAFISLVGAGGKSSLLQRMAQEFIQKKKKIILTTSTKMFVSQIALFIKEGQIIETHCAEVMEEGIKNYFEQNRNKGIAILLAHRLMEDGNEKFSGPETRYLDKWWRDGLADFFIVEADGAKGRPIKAPDYHEPVIPEMVSNVIAVIGIDAIGLRLEEKNVFRSSLFSNLTGLKLGKKINIETITALVNHPEGLYKNSPDFTKRHLFLNKVNNIEKVQIATDIALAVFMDNQAHISTIIVGDTLKKDGIVLKVINGKIE